jgi:hypothetical protein
MTKSAKGFAFGSDFQKPLSHDLALSHEPKFYSRYEFGFAFEKALKAKFNNMIKWLDKLVLSS